MRCSHEIRFITDFLRLFGVCLADFAQIQQVLQIESPDTVYRSLMIVVIFADMSRVICKRHGDMANNIISFCIHLQMLQILHLFLVFNEYNSLIPCGHWNTVPQSYIFLPPFHCARAIDTPTQYTYSVCLHSFILSPNSHHRHIVISHQSYHQLL